MKTRPTNARPPGRDRPQAGRSARFIIAFVLIVLTASVMGYFASEKLNAWEQTHERLLGEGR